MISSREGMLVIYARDHGIKLSTSDCCSQQGSTLDTRISEAESAPVLLSASGRRRQQMSAGRESSPSEVGEVDAGLRRTTDSDLFLL